MVTKHAPFLDRMYFEGKQNQRYLQEATFISSVLQRTAKGKALVDAGCGTGIHMHLLGTMGLDVSGFDSRVEMVAVAKRRNPKKVIRQGDMRHFPFNGTFDGITCMYGAINYLETKAEIRTTIRGFADHLAPGGVAIVDTRFHPNLDERTRIWSTDEWTLAKRWIKCSGTTHSVYRVFYAIPDEGIMEMEDHRQYFQDPFWIAGLMTEEGFSFASVYESYDLSREFQPDSGSALSVVVGVKSANHVL